MDYAGSRHPGERSMEVALAVWLSGWLAFCLRLAGNTSAVGGKTVRGTVRGAVRRLRGGRDRFIEADQL